MRKLILFLYGAMIIGLSTTIAITCSPTLPNVDIATNIFVYGMVLCGIGSGTAVMNIALDGVRIQWRYIFFDAHFSTKRYWFPKGIWSVILFLNDPFYDQRPKWTFSYYDSYESINSESGFFLWPWILYYRSIGYTKKKQNLSIDKYNKENVCSWSPYQNVN